MNLDKIKEIIRSKNKFDDNIVDVLAEYLLAVQDCLSDYISLDEAIKRLIEGDVIENGIIRVNRSEINAPGEPDAAYSFNNKCIKLDVRLSDETYIKYVTFHELTHALSIQKRDDESKVVIGLENESIGVKRLGINEAVTEYLALKICKEKYDYDGHSTYRVAVEQLINTMNLIDEKDIMHCYFYESEKFDDLIKKSNFKNAIYFNNIFNILICKEKSIVQLKRNQMPEDEKNTWLSTIKLELYYWYTSKYLPLDSLEKFEEKLKFIQQFINQHDSLNYVDQYSTYIDVVCDVQELEEIGIEKSKIDELLDKYQIDREKMKVYADFNFTDSIGNEEKERTEKAIKMYEKYKEFGREKFVEICDTFFMRLYDDFFIEEPANNMDLYLYMKIPFMGKFLKENPQYDFDELAISRLDYSKIVNGKTVRSDWLYIVKTQDKKFHIVFEEFNNGTSFISREIATNDFVLMYKNEALRLKLENGKIMMQDLNNANAKFCVNIRYDKKSNYEQMRKLAADYGTSANNVEQEECLEILNEMTERISCRRKIDSLDVNELDGSIEI